MKNIHLNNIKYEILFKLNKLFKIYCDCMTLSCFKLY